MKALISEKWKSMAWGQFEDSEDSVVSAKPDIYAYLFSIWPLYIIKGDNLLSEQIEKKNLYDFF